MSNTRDAKSSMGFSTSCGAVAPGGAPHRRLLDPFRRKEGLRGKTPKTVAYLEGKPKEDSSMRQRQTCPKAFTTRSACLARHGEATLPNLAFQRRNGTLVVVDNACCNVPEIHWGFPDQQNALFGKRWEVIPFKEAKGHLKALERLTSENAGCPSLRE
jgi:hypothetical protein